MYLSLHFSYVKCFKIKNKSRELGNYSKVNCLPGHWSLLENSIWNVPPSHWSLFCSLRILCENPAIGGIHPNQLLPSAGSLCCLAVANARYPSHPCLCRHPPPFPSPPIFSAYGCSHSVFFSVASPWEAQRQKRLKEVSPFLSTNHGLGPTGMQWEELS